MKVELIDYFGSDLMVVNAARTSYGKQKSSMDDKDVKLINFLVRENHWAPFAHPQISFRVNCSIVVERQLFKHKISVCLAGDSEVTFKTLAGSLKKVRIEDLYTQWNNGRKHQNTPKDKEYVRRRIQGMNLRVLNEKTGIFENSNLKNISYSGIQDVYEITLESGDKLKCTKNHQIFTQEGWCSIEDGLSTASFVGLNGVKFAGTGDYQNKDYLLDLKNQGNSVSDMAEICGCSYHTIRKWLKIHDIVFDNTKFYFAKGNLPWNQGKRYKLNLSEEARKKRSEHGKLHNKSGAESPLWRGGCVGERAKIAAWTNKKARSVHVKYNFTCQKCGCSSGKLCAHHIIPVAQNPEKAYEFENLITVCQECHKKIHFSVENENNFATSVLDEEFVPFCYNKKNGLDENGGKASLKLKVHFSKVKSIKKIGKEKTYDIEVAGEWHNFVANNIVVHNCDSSISGRYVDFSDNYDFPSQLRYQSKDSKQGSAGLLDVELNEKLVSRMNDVVELAKTVYSELEAAGVAKEQCRYVCPLGLETTFIRTMSLYSFINMCKLRLKSDTQQETREVVQKMLDLVKNIEYNPFKHTLAAFGL